MLREAFSHSSLAPFMLTLQMDLLRTFATVADLASFTRAGDLLGRTQPAISLQIKKLEDLVQAPLLERDTRQLRLTAKGETLAIYARQILSLHDEAVARLRQPEIKGSVRIGIPNDFAVFLLPEVLGDFAAANAGVTVDVICDISTALLQGLKNGAYDLVVAMTAEPAALPAAKLWPERLAWVSGHAKPAETLRPLPLVVYPEGCTYRARMTRALTRAGIPWRIACTTPSLAGLQAAAQAGLGVTVLSTHTIPPGLRVLGPEAAFPGLPDVTIGLYYDRGRLSEAASSLINFLIQRLDECCQIPGGCAPSS